jgi:CRISPR-associated protein Csm1
MSDKNVLDASCRMALAAFLHDLGKFAERARIPQANDKVDNAGNTRAEIEKQNNCPSYNGRHTHVHAAYTAIGIDRLEQHLPELVGEDMTPFAPWREKNADDSSINAAARHHRADTWLQWIIASADRLASGLSSCVFGESNQILGMELEQAARRTLGLPDEQPE